MERIGDMVERETVRSPFPGVMGHDRPQLPAAKRTCWRLSPAPGVRADIPTVLLPGLFRCQGNMLETVLTASMWLSFYVI